MTEQEVLEIFAAKIEILKNREQALKGYRKEVPEYTPVYDKTVKLWEGLKVHASQDSFPKKLFREKAPNEHQLEFDYREKSYQPSTRSVYREGVSNINRIFNEQNYSISGWGNNEGIYEDSPAKNYFIQDYPEYGSLTNYFKHAVKSEMLEDSNGVIALDIDNLDEISTDDTRLTEPILSIFNCDKVLAWKHKKYALVLLEEKSRVEYGGKLVDDGLVFRLYDENIIWKIYQTGKKVDWEFSVDVYFQHNLGYCPAWKLGGIPKKKKGETYFESFVNDCVPKLNDALYNDSTLRSLIVAFAFPERWEFEQDCKECEGTGKIQDLERGLISCNNCKGTGAEKPSMFRTIYMKVKGQYDQGEQLKPPPAGYITKPVEILEFLNTQIEKKEKAAFSFMGIEVSAERANGDETATGRLIDREALFSFLIDVSANIFELMKEAIWALGQVRYGLADRDGERGFKYPEIKQPTNFAIRTEDDLIREIGEATKNNTPDYIRGQMYKELLNQRFSSETEVKLVGELQAKIDGLYLRSTDEVLKLKAQGLTSDWKAVLHFEFDTIVQQLIEENTEFLSLEFADQRTQIEDRARGLVPQQAGGSTDEIEALLRNLNPVN